MKYHKQIFKIYKLLKNMSDSKNNQNSSEKADKTINKHVLWSMGAGLIPFPVADFLAVAAVQMDMIKNISQIYQVDFKETETKAIITALTSSGLSRIGASAIVKMVPIVGSALGGISMSVLSGASTYALGQVFKSHFENGGTILDFDLDRFKKFYDDQFEKGKKVAEDLKDETEPKSAASQSQEFSKEDVLTNSPDIVKKLKELSELKEMGVIDEEEFKQMKARLIENYYKK
jgi:uncharacterized protein (DUF697 family)